MVLVICFTPARYRHNLPLPPTPPHQSNKPQELRTALYTKGYIKTLPARYLPSSYASRRKSYASPIKAYPYPFKVMQYQLWRYL